MLQLKRNDLLIGFTISVLLSIFVNFALLMRKYEFETGNPSMGIQPLVLRVLLHLIYCQQLDV